MATSLPAVPQPTFVDTIRKAIADTLTQSLGVAWSAEVNSDAASQPADGPRICFGLAFSGALHGIAAIQFGQADALMLAQRLRSEAADPAAQMIAEHKQSLQTLLTQISAAAAAALQTQLGTLEAKLSGIDSPTWPGAAILLLVSEPSAGKLILELRFDPELTASLGTAAAADAGTRNATTNAPVVTETNLDLLLGVGLNLTLRFGQRVLTLREILDLGSGSVVELDRQVQEPADLLLGDRLVARGEVVIVDGNYGVRVTEVVDPRQRIDRV